MDVFTWPLWRLFRNFCVFINYSTILKEAPLEIFCVAFALNLSLCTKLTCRFSLITFESAFLASDTS